MRVGQRRRPMPRQIDAQFRHRGDGERVSLTGADAYRLDMDTAASELAEDRGHHG